MKQLRTSLLATRLNDRLHLVCRTATKDLALDPIFSHLVYCFRITCQCFNIHIGHNHLFGTCCTMSDHALERNRNLGTSSRSTKWTFSLPLTVGITHVAKHHGNLIFKRTCGNNRIKECRFTKCVVTLTNRTSILQCPIS